MRNLNVWRIGFALAIIVGLASPRAAMAYTCPLAPRHGTLCRYTDPGLFKSLAANAEAELMRLGAVNASVPLMKAITQATGRSASTVVQYDSLLQMVTRPRVPVPRAFAAAWTLIHPDALVRVRYANGQTEVVNVAEEAQHYLAAATQSASGDPLGVMARQVAGLASANDQGGTAEYASVLQRVGLSGRGAIATGADLAHAGNDLAGAVRTGPTGMAGQSRAAILSTKGALDQTKGIESALRMDAAEDVVRAAAAASRARAARRRVIRDALDTGRP
jgi:hypothetical protein